MRKFITQGSYSLYSPESGEQSLVVKHAEFLKPFLGIGGKIIEKKVGD